MHKSAILYTAAAVTDLRLFFRFFTLPVDMPRCSATSSFLHVSASQLLQAQKSAVKSQCMHSTQCTIYHLHLPQRHSLVLLSQTAELHPQPAHQNQVRQFDLSLPKFA